MARGSRSRGRRTQTRLQRAITLCGLCVLLACSDRAEHAHEHASEEVAVAAAALTSSTNVNALGDAYLTSGNPNTNHGGDTFIRLQASGKNRGLVFFDNTAIRNAVGTGSLVSATLKVTIQSADTGWGSSGRPISVHRLKQASAEFSATWNCAIDASIQNSTADCSGATAWSMSSTDPNVEPWVATASASATITNSETGSVSFDVTADIAAMLANTWGGYGFLLKKVDETANGAVDFKSREQGASLGPVLVLSVQAAPGTGGSGGPPMDAGVQSATVVASADSHVREGDPNQNFGAVSPLRIQASGRNRGLIKFDQTAIRNVLGSDGLRGAALQITIAKTFTGWGPDRALGVHRMQQDWSEPGVTWNCSVDSNPSNSSADCSGSTAWAMWRPDLPAAQIPWIDPPTSTVLISDNQTGVITFDVTRDVACQLAGFSPWAGFLIKKEAEQQSGHIELASRETATPPVLVIQHAAGAGVTVTAALCGQGVLTDGGVSDAGTGCTPTATTDVTCNGVDDDCDGKKDEDYEVTVTSCGVGACAASGEKSCVNGVQQDSCVAGTPGGTDATCDGIDDNCNGTKDEGYVGVATSCGIGACARTGTSSCVNGAVQSNCTAGMPAANDVTCDGVDDNCNGTKDEGYVGVATSCGAGACARTGTSSCVNGAVQSNCTPGTPSANDATCDGIDDNCNGMKDEGYVGVATNCGVGACARTGTSACVTGVVQSNCAPGTPAPSDATCDGVDDNCNGTKDEGYVGVTTSCGVGACARTGTSSCVNGAVQSNCSPGTAAANDTTCDGIDDNCNGTSDEGYISVATNCGVGACASAGSTSCVTGHVADSCAPKTPASSDTTCNAVDDDCDGKTDEDFVTTPVTCGTGACLAAGATVCSGGQVVQQCNPGTAAANDAVCDGIDSDCDGLIDEDYALTSSSCGIGGCARTGVIVCSNGSLRNTCVAGAPSPSDTTCDGIDDDCDGRVDENFAPRLSTCGVGACASSGTTQCVGGHRSDSCAPHAAASADTTCDGVDDDCDGKLDEDYTAAVSSCGVGACASHGSRTCVAGSLHDSCKPGSAIDGDANCDAVDGDCDGKTDEGFVSEPASCGVGACVATGHTTCVAGVVGSSCTPGVGSTSDANCNGIDDNCNGQVDEGYQPQPTSCGIGICASSGTTSCTNGIVHDTCVSGVPLSSDAECDGLDGDCDGKVDEEFPAASTTCGSAGCTGGGALMCVAGHAIDTCTPRVPSASDPTCDGLDDDCDGTSDEDYAPVATSCGLGPCTRTGASSCVNGHVQSNCSPGTPATSSDTTCDGKDDNCNGFVDEDYVSVSATCGVGACQATGTTSCSNGSVQTNCVPLPGASSDATCNAIDDDCDGKLDEDFTGVNDGNPCTIDTCDPSTGTIAHVSAPSGTSCSDGNVCNGNEVCQPTSSAGCAAPPAGIVAWWPGDGSGSDIGGQHLDGVLANGLGFAAGEVGQGFRFDGVDDTLDLSAHAPALNLAGQATLELWVQVPTDTCHTIFDLRQDATHEQFLQVGDGCTGTLTNELVTWTYINGGTPTVAGFTTTTRSLIIDPTRFHHLALTFDGLTMTIVIDGISRTVTVGQGTALGRWGNFTSPQSAALGALPNNPLVGFQTMLDEVTLYDRPLSIVTIRQISSARTAGKCKATATSCTAGSPPSLDDGNACTVDSCDPTLGIQHTPVAAGASCTDSNACTLSDQCNSTGQCSGVAVNTDDANACTTDVCDPSTGAITHTAISIDDGNTCTADSCDLALGVKHTPTPGAGCDDLSGCTAGDVCDAKGACHGAPVDASDGNPCTDDSCSSTSASTYTITHSTKGNGAVCSDGNVCNGQDTCRTSAASCTPLPSGAVALWPADDHATDVVSGTHAVPVGQLAYTTETWGRAFSFNGTDAYLNLDASAATLNLAGKGTLELWTRVSADTCQTLFDLRQDATHEQKIQVGDGCTSALTNELVTVSYTNGSATSVIGYVTLNRAILVGSTHHLAVTFDGSATRIYVDGTAVATTVGQGTAQGIWGGFVSPVNGTLGASRAGTNASALFNGTMDEVAIYNRALSASEILAIKNAGHKCWTPFCDPAGTPLSTDDGNPCTADSCDPAQGVKHVQVPAGGACDDGDRCTVQDTCSAQGICSGHAADFCKNIGKSCHTDADCGSDGLDGVCLTEAETGVPGGECVVSCASAACPSGTSCVGLFGSDVNPLVSEPAVRNGSPLLRACVRSCSASGACPRSTEQCDHDIDPTHGACREGCGSTGDCSTGHHCDCVLGQACSTTNESAFCVANTPETNCSDGKDEDGDGLVDCADSDCAGKPGCGEICNNNIDDDGDGAIDCHDSECHIQCELCDFGQPGFVPGVDEDGDGLADCLDPDCKAIGTLCVEGTAAHCGDQVDNDLDGLTDCEDPDCVAIGFAACHECPTCNGDCADGKDNDADGLVDCRDPDCGAASGCAENTDARCSDGLDNDADGFVDCLDPDCNVANGVTRCTEGGPSNLNCSDLLDNDLDGLVDCADPDCACFERCNDGIDNDGNGLVDCADTAHCLHDPACVEICDDGIDNNGVFGADCLDPNCDGFPGCVETVCDDGIDNERDGRTDCADPDCSSSPACPEICDNGVDDNADQKIDCADPQCAGAGACNESLHCKDGIDNDLDGLLDCADSECAGGPPCVPEVCGNTIDDDGDGMFDCADPDCAAFPACTASAPRARDVAPPLDPTVPTMPFESTRFIYAGPSPVQYFMDPATIVRDRVAVISGRALTIDSNPLPGALVTVAGHSEFGETRTDPDGRFTLVVNGGDRLTLQYELPGYVRVQRGIDISWQDQAVVDDVVMTPLSSKYDVIALDGSQPLQVAQGPVSTDDEGPRHATVLFPAGLEAQMRMRNGTALPLPSATVRATEVTVGPNGPKAMVAELPPASAYTYAVDLSVDEAEAAGARSVEFSAPVWLYVENFIGAPVGSAVPVGFYEPAGSCSGGSCVGEWIPSDNGRVLRILATSDGKASVDLDGGGVPADESALGASGFTTDELQRLAVLYGAGQELWRVPVQHFTVYDCNWGRSLGGLPPRLTLPPNRKSKRRCEDEIVPGSRIGCFGQTMGEDIPIAGTPYDLHYESSRLGLTRHSFDVQGDGAVVDNPNLSLTSIELSVLVAGRRFSYALPTTRAQSMHFEFDGLDQFGRPVAGTQIAQVGLCYMYRAPYWVSPPEVQRAFNARGFLQAGTNITFPSRPEDPMKACRRSSTSLETPITGPVGGWTISAHHTFDPVSKEVLRGDGREEARSELLPVATIAAGAGVPRFGTGGCDQLHLSLYECGLDEAENPRGTTDLALWWPKAVAVAPDGTLFIADRNARAGYPGLDYLDYVVRLRPDGRASRIFGWLPGGAATKLGTQIAAHIDDLQIGPDGMLYIRTSDVGAQTAGYVYRVATDGTSVEVIAGSADPSATANPDGIPATEARLPYNGPIAFAPDGTLYIADLYRVLQVRTDGRISTVAGVRDPSFALPGNHPVDIYQNTDSYRVSATSFDFGRSINGIAVHPDGDLFIATDGGLFVVGSDGIIRLAAGGASWLGSVGDPIRAVPSARGFQNVAISKSGDIYTFGVNEESVPGIDLLRDGEMIPLATEGAITPDGRFSNGQSGYRSMNATVEIAVHPDGDLLIGDRNEYFVTRLHTSTFEPKNTHPSADGLAVYEFSNGHHTRTLNALTGRPVLTFDYDATGALVSVSDVSRNVTTIQRDSRGLPTSIRSPFGVTTGIETDSQGRLASLVGPLDDRYSFNYDPGSLRLRTLTDPRGNAAYFDYDPDGRLVRDTDKAGGVQTFVRTESLTKEPISNEPTLSKVERLQSGVDSASEYSEEPVGGVTELRRTAFEPDGMQEQISGAPTVETVVSQDGTITRTTRVPDPRLGEGVLYPYEEETALPSGAHIVRREVRSVTLRDPSDPFSVEEATTTDSLPQFGETWTTHYDARARQVVRTTPMGREETIDLDSLGRPSKVRVPGFAPLQYTWDGRGRITAIVVGENETSRAVAYAYGDGTGYLERVTGPTGDMSTSVTVDPAGRPLTVSNGGGALTRLTYDVAGNTISIAPPSREVHTMSWTELGFPSSYKAPDAGNTVALAEDFRYTSQRTLAEVDLPDGSRTAFNYGPNGKLSSITTPRGLRTIEYDSVTGQVSRETTEEQRTLTSTFDGRYVSSVTWGGPSEAVAGALTISYDDHLRPGSLAVNGGVVASYNYDHDGLVLSAGGLAIDRDPKNGQVTGTTLGLVTTQTVQSEFGETDLSTSRYNGTVVFSELIAQRDAAGRLLARVETVDGLEKSYQYYYDQAGRLSEVDVDGQLSSQYVYDPNGNCTLCGSVSDPRVGTYDEQDRVQSYGQLQFAFTANGDLQSRVDSATGKSTGYEYDSFGNLRTVALPDGRVIEYEVDAENRRVGKRLDGVLEYGLLYADALHPIAMLGADNSMVATFIYATHSNVPDYMTKDGATYRFLVDHIGSVRAVVNVSSGETAQRIEYDELGRVLIDTNPGFQPFGFAGGLYDPNTGLVRFGARDYDSETGRWTAKDPLLFGGGDTNLYAYVFGDPINWIDPTGLLVTIDYDVSSGRLAVIDDDTGEMAVASAHSGDKPLWPDTSKGPIPGGAWDILDYKGSDVKYRLDARDSNPRDDVYQPSGRDKFRLHKGHFTNGCVNVVDAAQWDAINRIISHTKTEIVSDNREPSGLKGLLGLSNEPIKRFGVMWVH